MPGARCTRGLVCKSAQSRRTRAYRYSRNTPAFPAQWFYGLCRALPGDEFILPPSLREFAVIVEPGRVTFASAKLDASHGRQDHTVLPYAATPLVLRGKQSLTAKGRPAITLARDAVGSTAARTPRIVTTRTPLFDEAGWHQEATNFGKRKADYFLRLIWTTQITLKTLVEFTSARNAFCGVFDAAAARSTD
jgi:hypothetical protein